MFKEIKELSDVAKGQASLIVIIVNLFKIINVYWCSLFTLVVSPGTSRCLLCLNYGMSLCAYLTLIDVI